MNASEDEDAHEMGFSDFMSDLEGQVKDLMKKTNKAPTDAYQGWVAFSSAIDWKETWIVSLLTFHVLLFILIVVTRKRLGVQSCIFFFISILVRLAERINTYCSSHWQDFSTQNYFDKNGIFAGVLFSAPLLAMCLMMLVSN
jgi:transmembrane protein 18